MNNLQKKYENLKRIIAGYRGLVVAYSGGVDSTFLLKAASATLSDNVLAVTAISETYPRAELNQAKKIARRLGVRHRVINTDELSDRRFVANPIDRCYWCKRELLKKLKDIAREEGMTRVALASHLDDLADYRPGEAAAREMMAVAPLREAGFDKREIREMSRRLGVPGYAREAMPCLASRIPYGQRIDEDVLKRIERGEAYLRKKGFKRVRIRASDVSARIEVDKRQIGRFLRRDIRDNVLRYLKRLGFLYISVDLEGYRTGSMNLPLFESSKVPALEFR